MSITYATGREPLELLEPYDPDEKKYYTLSYRPKDWEADTEYGKGRHLVIPTTANGLMYECTSSGISAATEPTWTVAEGGSIVDGGVTWRVRSYNLLLQTGDVITTSTWAGPVDTVLDNPVLIDGSHAKVRLTSVATGATSIILTNTIEVTRDNGDLEEFNRGLVITVKEL